MYVYKEQTYDAFVVCLSDWSLIQQKEVIL